MRQLQRKYKESNDLYKVKKCQDSAFVIKEYEHIIQIERKI